MSEIFSDLAPLSRGLDATAFRHKILAGNLANANTPGYVRHDVKFEELLKERLGSSKPSTVKFREIVASIDPKVVQDPTGQFTNGNNVVLEKETSLISRNEILYNIYSEILSLKIGQLKQAISSK